MESFVLYSPSSTSTAFSPLFPSSRISLHLRSRPHLPRSPPSISPNPICTLRATPSSLSSISPSSLSLLNSNHLSFNPLPKPDKTHKPIQASATPPSTESPIESKPQGAKIIPLIISASVGLIVRFLIPKPIEVTAQTWQLLAIFLSTIAGLVLNPLPLGAWAFIALTTSVVTRTLSFSTAFGAFTNEVIWLIVISFFFARGFVKTGLGDRIATDFVKWLGKSTLGLSYGLTFSEAVIAPAMPSTTAREGGVFVPIIKSLAPSAGSKPGEPSAKKLG